MAAINWRSIIFAALTMLVIAVIAVLFLFDPAQNGFYPGCALYKTTGLYCPGCGGLRAVHQLLHGRILPAFHFNPLFVASLPVFLWLFARALLRYLNGNPFLAAIKPNWLWSGGAVLVLFGVLRNLPCQTFAWMRP